MNVKEGFKRIGWVLSSIVVLFSAVLGVVCGEFWFFSLAGLVLGFGPWVIYYTGCWIVRGFTSKDFTRLTVDNPVDSSDDKLQDSKENLGEANKAIKRAWIAGIVAGTFQVLLGIFCNPWFFIDAAIFYVSSFGVYAKNRILSLVMLLYCLINVAQKVYQIQEGEGVGVQVGVIIFLIIAWFVFKGVCGIFAYHKVTESEEKPKDEQKE